ncbi:shikimate dehydrogenase [Acetobacter sp. AN02]|uniref:shikimate dehydrogenase n=1 Tax=Acetobacter sp. AN02 TaxID=2894186 RepID=UPI00243440E0|nr:shikimate dehydrogenase [Acetobacter sp. AN02]MDG6093748.1 shikimate dehydrogenase [Acetobacter sp. AN02]
MIDGGTLLAGVAGWPVSHSRSPGLHNYWLARHGINGAYVPLPVQPGKFEEAVRGLQAAGFRGLNVTIPHKETAFRLATRLDPVAKRSGSVNTLVFREDGVIDGYSTDGPGLLASLKQETGYQPSGHAFILGAGGAARSVAAALLEQGVTLTVSNRTRARAEELAQALDPAIRVADWTGWEALLGDADLLINTTSLGMSGGPDPAFCPDLSAARPDLIVSDIVYVPLETPLLREAARCGLKAAGGLGMLLHQARLGFREWFGADPEVDAATFSHVLGK